MKEQYDIVRKLCENNRNSIFLARDRAVGKNWVIKVSGYSAGTGNGGENDSGRHELQILQRLDHRGIVTVVDYWEEEGACSMVTEYVEGMTLQQQLDRAGPVDEGRALAWAAELADILKYLHELEEPVYYLDMKPSNIMIGLDGHVRLIDFDAARGREHQFDAGEAKRACKMGTYGYAAPEQCAIRPSKGPDERTDIYGLGMTLYAMVTGMNPAKPPYGLREDKQWRALVSEPLYELVRQCTHPERQRRCPSAGNLLQELYLIEQNRKEEANHKKLLHRRKKDRVIQRKSIFLTDKKYAGLLILWLLLGWCCLSAMKGYAGSAADEPLLVVLRNREGQKLLLQEGALFQVQGALKLEIPQDNLFADSTILIRVKENGGDGRKVRELYVRKKENGVP